MLIKTKNYINKNKTWILVVFFVILFLHIAYRISSNNIEDFDRFIYDNLMLVKSDFTTVIMKTITNLANMYTLIFFSLIFILIVKSKKKTIIMAINALNFVVLTQLLKLIFSRPRPLDISMIEETGFSFPSGHSVAALSFYGLLIYFVWNTNYKKDIKVLITILLCVFILLIGVSRVYLGVHYPSDVIAGFSISLAYLLTYTKLIANYLNKKRVT